MNENSSRSHAVMTITLSSEMPDPEDPQVINTELDSDLYTRWDIAALAPFW